MTDAPQPIVTTRPAAAADMAEILCLNARVFGPGRFARTAYRIREGTPDLSEFCRVAVMGERIIASIRMTDIVIGGRGGALLLGPLAVDPAFANRGYGRRLIAESIEAGAAADREIVVLVGDMPYYGRFGFMPVPAGSIVLPGPVNPARLLALELKPDALGRYRGPVLGVPKKSVPSDRETGGPL
jgi:predicted N-acetyltransferase YhbS